MRLCQQHRRPATPPPVVVIRLQLLVFSTAAIVLLAQMIDSETIRNRTTLVFPHSPMDLDESLTSSPTPDVPVPTTVESPGEDQAWRFVSAVLLHQLFPNPLDQRATAAHRQGTSLKIG